MKTYTIKEVEDIMIEAASDTQPGEALIDEDGQIIMCTGIYRWNDGSFRDVAEFNYCGAV
jgi:hypothetical protein